MTDTEPLGPRVDALLAAAGLAADDRTRTDLIHMYAQLQPGVEAMYAIPEARYEEPALLFDAAPKLERWPS